MNDLFVGKLRALRPLAVIGAIGGGSAASRLRSETLSLDEARALRDSGSTYQRVGFVGLGVGIAGLLTGALMAALGGPADSTLSLALLPGGATVGLRLPLAY